MSNQYDAVREYAPLASRSTSPLASLGGLIGTKESQPPQSGQVETTIQSISNWLDDLQAAIKNLEVSLQPCLQPPFENQAHDNSKLPRPTCSVLAEKLYSIQSRTMDAVRTLQCLKDRVDL